MTESTQTLGIIGGTGPEGRGLALRFARAGHRVIIGSRSADRAIEAARQVGDQAEVEIAGATNAEVAARSETAILTIPYGGLRETLPPLAAPLAHKIVICAVAPIEFVDGRPVARRVEAGSAAEEARALLPNCRLVSAFQTVDSYRLQRPHMDLDTDVIICSDDVDARRTVQTLASDLPGVRALSGGRLAASRYVEECTALLITINRIYRAHSGIRLTGVNR